MNNTARAPHTNFVRWLSTHNIKNITILSPHLDDAVFSLAGVLRLQGLPPVCVATFITMASRAPGADASHDNAGVRSIQEYAERRQEDIAAMEFLGVDWLHLDAPADGFEEGDVRRGADEILNAVGGDKKLVLLPLGAGRELSVTTRFLKRVLRQPFGSPSHGEHIDVRDKFRDAFAQTKAILGYYAEIPYQSANSSGELKNLAAAQLGPQCLNIEVQPDVDAKLEAVRCYASQFAKEFGHKTWYQRRSMATTERLFLPVAALPGSSGQP